MPSDAKRRVEQTAERRASARDVPRHKGAKNRSRKSRCKKDLKRFLTTYLAKWFPLKFSPDHEEVIEMLQSTVLDGALQAVAMPRGNGKTTIFKGACVWAQGYGHRRFVFAVAASAKKGEQIVSSIKRAWSQNPLLAEDFPEVCDYIRALQGISRRAEGQTSEGEETMLVWNKDEVRLPKFALGGGSVVRSAGITGEIRGAVADLADGSQIRPDLVLIDDPQTKESAGSTSQVESRMEIVQGDILGLAGPGETLACLCACTVIRKGDLADTLLDRELHPEWQGLKFSLMRSMPSNVALWDQYGEILREDLRTKKGTARANEFYRANRAEMDAGAVASWPERKLKTELSAIQHAMNKRIIHGDAAFRAEYQNDPVDPLANSDVVQITAPAVLRKLNGHDRDLVPFDDTILAGAIDVQGACLYHGIAGWTPGFSGDLIRYGTYPDQGRPYFTVREVAEKGNTMEKMHPGSTWEAALYASLEVLVEQMCGREWMRDDGTVARVEQVVIDASYGKSTETVYKFCRASKYASILIPYQGRGFSAGALPLNEWKKAPGDRVTPGVGPSWRITRPKARQVRHVLADANACKSFIAARLLTPPGGAGCFSIYGKNPSEHRMLADQLASEIRTIVAANGRTSEEWRVKPNQDNHFLDVVSMLAIGASMRGCKLDEQEVSRRLRAAPTTSQTSGPGDATPPIPRPPSPSPTAPAPVVPRPRGGGGWMGGFGFTGGRF